MVKLICEKCKRDCEPFAYDIQIDLLDNPCPTWLSGNCRGQIVGSDYAIRFQLCPDCYKQLDLPNVLRTFDEGKLVFNEREVNDE